MDCRQLAKLIDHSLLQANTSESDLQLACDIARRYSVACLIVKPYHVAKAVELMRGSGVPVGTTVGFPHGCNASAVKAFEAETALKDGAVEVDMVANIGAVKSGDWRFVEQDIAGVVAVARPQRAIVKVIIEACYLTNEEKVRVCEVVQAAGADFVKSTTGYGPSGAQPDDIRLMRQVVGPAMGVKASGGIRTLKQTLELIEAGANRIGTSSTQAILEECAQRG
ncbi:MAG: deoxyribose-phosphate aldolase [Dehalococcoidales bacterium]|nr:deoxyribose-phosphate aldolase [Dehalococcoidales bacterium]